MSEALRRLGEVAGTLGVVGSMNADYTMRVAHLPGPGETVPGGPMEILPGGKSGNQAAQAAKLGATVRMFGAVGTDPNGAFLLHCLDEAGVDTSHIRRLPGPSGATMITVDAAAENTIVYAAGANGALDTAWIEDIAPELSRCTVLGLCLESPVEVVTAAAEIVHAAGGTVVLNDSPFTPHLPADLVAATDVLIVNEHEAQALLGLSAAEAADRQTLGSALRAAGFGAGVVTLGARGAVVLTDGEVHKVAPVAVEACDTTGCGDAFMATILAGLASKWSLTEAAETASYVAALAATRPGAQVSYATAAEVQAAFG